MSRLNSKTITYEQLAKVIDHSLLRPELTEEDVIAGCELAARYHVATVCVKPCHVTLAKEALKDSDVLVSTVRSITGSAKCRTGRSFAGVMVRRQPASGTSGT